MLSKGIGTMATTATMAARSLSMVYVPAHKPKWIFTPLKKLHAALSLSVPDSVLDVELQERDITSNPEWEKAYQYEIPVLAIVLSDGTEETIKEDFIPSHT
ncbi:Detected protein of confused Function [Hibiscus syriacus]|uniref:Glutaredoxin-like protein n=1 Tax=Hibiscus syriacus TaxID=106335 RepID=A0A6A3BK64_HIBSY|nr:Detected protein of confused Function [Hibiscus syriacus]